MRSSVSVIPIPADLACSVSKIKYSDSDRLKGPYAFEENGVVGD
jgi:hypothetical protein